MKYKNQFNIGIYSYYLRINFISKFKINNLEFDCKNIHNIYGL